MDTTLRFARHGRTVAARSATRTLAVIIFSDEHRAAEGLRTLEDLHHLGDPRLRAAATIAKDMQGATRVRRGGGAGPETTLLGSLLGSLIGAVAGPFGLLVGAVTGALLGAAVDLSQVGISDAQVAEAGELLRPGEVAVIADIDEARETLLSARMEALHGRVVRHHRVHTKERSTTVSVGTLSHLPRRFRATAARNRTRSERLVPIGRALYAAIFILASFGHFSRATIDVATRQGVPFAAILVPASGLMALIGGVSVLTGYRTRIGAVLLILFLLPVTFTMHAFWAVHDPGMAELQRAMFFKNVALIGAALLLVHFGAGPYSLDVRHAAE